MDRYGLLIICALAAAPLAYAHTDGLPYGTPKTYCEDVKGDQHTHDYGPPATGVWVGPAFDGSLPPCPYDPQWDGHYEWAIGGAYILACEVNCGYGDAGAGALVCWETYADHVNHNTFWVFDHVLSTAGAPVSFKVTADQFDNVPDVDPTEPECGDFESDYGVDCVDHCTISFEPGLDGSYTVCVSGSQGHVWTTGGAFSAGVGVASATQDSPYLDGPKRTLGEFCGPIS